MTDPCTYQKQWSPWRTVVGFGVVSLTADMVYEGARSVYVPLLASLGASATIVGLITGAGEAAALLLRLVDRFITHNQPHERVSYCSRGIVEPLRHANQELVDG